MATGIDSTYYWHSETIIECLFSVKGKNMNSEEVMKLIVKRTEFLAENPHLVPIQEEIDKELKKAGKNNINRCVVIQEMLRDQVKALQSTNKEILEDIRELAKLTKE